MSILNVLRSQYDESNREIRSKYERKDSKIEDKLNLTLMLVNFMKFIVNGRIENIWKEFGKNEKIKAANSFTK